MRHGHGEVALPSEIPRALLATDAKSSRKRLRVSVKREGNEDEGSTRDAGADA
jgi:hypothetical protein